jgi:chemotaxis protein CheX
MLGGAPIGEDDDSVNDALGELCNMLAGGWKNSTPGLSAECVLSPPTVISGRNYKVHMSKPSLKVSRRYQFDVHSLDLIICLEDIGSVQNYELS